MSAVVRILASEDWVCPVDGITKFYDSWHEERVGGKLHQGVDLIGFRGARLRAPVNGRVEFYWDTIGGRSFRLYADNGDYYFGTHLLRFGSPGRVEAGDPVGQMGSSGNATGTHLHFEYHPGGRGNQVNPYPIVNAHCHDRIPIDVPLDHATNGG
jgi:murein DD-endopeptidase MepM/ murein hydrolase activator NlpD